MANTQTSTTTLPDWVQKPTQGALTDIQSWLKSPDNYVYGSKPGESLYTPLSQSQNEAIGNVNWLADQNLSKLLGIDKAGGLWDKYTGAGPQTITGNYKNAVGAGITTSNNAAGQAIKGGGVAGQIDPSKYGQGSNTLSGERIVDENGYLGAIGDYMNPYLQQVLDPQLRELDEGRQRAIRDQGASQQMAGAFGDARHGIMDAEIFGKTQEAIGDVTGRTMAQGFDTAMGLRGGDMAREAALQEAALGRGLGAEQTNLGFKESALGRDLQAGLAKAGFAENDINRQLEAALARAGFAENDVNRMLQRDTLNQTARENAVNRTGLGAKAASDLGQTYLKSFTDVNDALFNAGQVERDARQEQSDATRKFQEAISGKRYNDALRMLGALQGTAQPTTTTSEQESNDGLMGILGSVLGGLFA